MRGLSCAAWNDAVLSRIITDTMCCRQISGISRLSTTRASLLMGPKAKVITPTIVESWFSTSTELTAAMALLQTLAVSVALVLLFTVARRATQPPGE